MSQNPIPTEPHPCSHIQEPVKDWCENSAKKSAFFFKPEKIIPNQNLFLDIGMVDLVKHPVEKTHYKHPEEIAIVNEIGWAHSTLWARVKVDHENVCNYFTTISQVSGHNTSQVYKKNSKSKLV